ncbi:MAG: hypothetical protein IJ894_07475, partial [Bacteroidales bacterium]|nr:hypothetical protein [Bacteroidales bacterium]
IIKQLRSKNLARWKKMGYEPPSELHPLERAQSISTFRNTDNNLLTSKFFVIKILHLPLQRQLNNEKNK